MRMRMQETWPKRKPILILYSEESEAGCVMDVSEAVKRDVVRRVELKTLPTLAMTRTRWGCQESRHPR